MDTYIYPAIFKPYEERYCITFPDLPGCVTEGDTLKEAMYMAKEALELHLYGMEEDNDKIPTPSKPEDINCPEGYFIVPTEAYMPLIRSQIANKAVKKTLTIPYWLNKIAEDKKVNFSKLLQAALKEYLKINNFQ